MLMFLLFQKITFCFTSLQCVIDLIYNCCASQLLLDAEVLECSSHKWFKMLVARCARASFALLETGDVSGSQIESISRAPCFKRKHCTLLVCRELKTSTGFQQNPKLSLDRHFDFPHQAESSLRSGNLPTNAR